MWRGSQGKGSRIRLFGARLFLALDFIKIDVVVMAARQHDFDHRNAALRLYQRFLVESDALLAIPVHCRHQLLDSANCLKVGVLVVVTLDGCDLLSRQIQPLEKLKRQIALLVGLR